MSTTSSLFNAQSIDLDDLTRMDPLLVIPVYQRAYAWDASHVKSLIEDILEGILKHYQSSLGGVQMTYIGTIIHTRADQVLRAANIHGNVRQSWLIIDGQQRLTTISILALSLAYQLSLINAERVCELLKKIPGFGPLETLREELEKTTADLVRVIRVGREDESIPRIIRLGAEDKIDRFNSSLSFLIHAALTAYSNKKLHQFKPKHPPNHKGVNHERKRFEYLVAELAAFVYQRKEGLFSSLPDFKVLKDQWQDSSRFLGKRIPEDAFQSNEIAPDQRAELENAYRLCIFARYLLNRVAMTTVEGQNENLAYDVFDSLNTSGEPLNAYETFKPYVLRQLNSPSPEYSSALNSFQFIESIAQAPKTILKRQKLYGATVILHSLSESGERVGKKLADQHGALRKCYDQSQVKQDNLDALKSAIQVAAAFEDPEAHHKQGQFLPLLDEEAKVCFKFLSDIKHSLALAPITRCFDEYLKNNISQSDISDSVKAVTAFAVLWRAPRGGTAGIDAEFRLLMEQGFPSHSILPLARSRDPQVFEVCRLKQALRIRLKSAKDSNRYGDLVTKEQWVSRVKHQSLYATSKLTKMLLLAAQHDSAPDPASPGLIVSGNPGLAPSFTFNMYNSDQNYTIEHVAPQSDRSLHGWSSSFEVNADSVHWIGNLLLMPLNSNSMLHNRSWSVKRKIYAALSRQTKAERELLLGDPELQFLKMSSKQQVLDAPYMAPLDAVSRIQADWNLDFVNSRSERLLQLAYDKFNGWL